MEEHVPRQDGLPRKCHSHQKQCFLQHCALCLITHKRWVGDDKLLRGAADYTVEEDTTCLFQRVSRTGDSRMHSVSKAAWLCCVLSSLSRDEPLSNVLRQRRHETRGFSFYSTVFNLKSCIFTWCVQIYSGLLWQRLQQLLLGAGLKCQLTSEAAFFSGSCAPLPEILSVKQAKQQINEFMQLFF